MGCYCSPIRVNVRSKEVFESYTEVRIDDDYNIILLYYVWCDRISLLRTYYGCAPLRWNGTCYDHPSNRLLRRARIWTRGCGPGPYGTCVKSTQTFNPFGLVGRPQDTKTIHTRTRYIRRYDYNNIAWRCSEGEKIVYQKKFKRRHELRLLCCRCYVLL